MRSGQLHGRNHEEIGLVAAIAEGPAAITLSRGGAPKTYSYLDPNEDSVVFACGPAGLLVAVADGHHGNGASDLVLTHLLEHFAPAWVEDPAELGDDAACETTRDAIEVLDAAILEQSARAKHPIGRTTLAMVLVRARERRLVCTSVGDSLILRVRVSDAATESLPRTPPPAGTAHTWFLGSEPWPARPLRQRVACQCLALDDTRAIAVATDGLSEEGIGVVDPQAAVGEAVAAACDEPADLRALAACKGITATALRSHRHHRSGDNLAAAVLWLDGPAPPAR